MHRFKQNAHVRPSKSLLAWIAFLAVGTLVVGFGLVGEFTPGHKPVLMANPGLTPLGDDDGDGIPNVADNVYHGADPARADNDGDGYRDGFELATGSDPSDFYSQPKEESGTRILVAPDGNNVYVVFLMASETGFVNTTSHKILFVQHVGGGPVAFTSIDVTAEFLKRVRKIDGLSGQVVSWTLKVPRNQVDLWSLGFGMNDNNETYCDGTVVQRRTNGYIYTLRFPANGVHVKTNLEPTEADTGSGPGQGFKECEQISYASPGSPLRHVLSEACETRDHYICPPDCGALAGQVVIDLKKIWLY